MWNNGINADQQEKKIPNLNSLYDKADKKHQQGITH